MSIKSTIKKVASKVSSVVKSVPTAIKNVAKVVSPVAQSAAVAKALTSKSSQPVLKATTTSAALQAANQNAATRAAKDVATYTTQTAANKAAATKSSSGTSDYTKTLTSNALTQLGNKTSSDYYSALSNVFGGTSTPTNTNNINNEVGGTTMPDTKNPITSSDSYSYLKGDEAKETTMNPFYDKMLQRETEFTKENQGWLDKLIGDRTTAQEETARLQRENDVMSLKQFQAEKAGIRAEATALQEKYNNVERLMNEQIAQETSRFGIQDFTNNRIAQIQRNAAPQLNYLSAQMSAKAAEIAAMNEDWETANKYINQQVDYIMKDQEDTLDLAFKLYDNNRENFDRIGDIYKSAYLEALETKKEELAYQRELLLTEEKLKLQAKYDKTGSSGGLTPSQINATVNSIAGSFDNEPIVKNYNTAQEGYQTISSIGTKTKSPADDIAFIYAFAKIMDPNSVVREGEYNTVQKYAQTWADNFGFTAKRIFSNTNFLSSDAKQKMLNALKPKINTLSTQYKNVASEYQRQIDAAYSGEPRQITDYSKAFEGETNNTNSPTKADIFDSVVSQDESSGWFKSLWDKFISK